MNNKIKITGIIIGTLLIGFVIGFLVNGRLVRTRVSQMKNFYTEKGAQHAFMRVIDPTPEQMEQIRPILQEHAWQNRDLYFEYRENQQQLFEHLEDELRPYLTEAQLARLSELKNRWQNRFEGRGLGRGPGFGRGPGPHGPRPGGRPGGGGPP